MRIRDKLNHKQGLSYEEWRRKLWRSFAVQFSLIAAAWIAAGAFTVWLLAR